jgi:hypothetical protein
MIGKKLAFLGALVIALLFPSKAQASTDFPVTEIRWWHQGSQTAWQTARLTVPDQDTSVSAYGGSLRRYDVHLAKMFEMTYHLCQQTQNLKGIGWQYEAANGNANMGMFRIRCQTAKEIVSGYRLGRTETTRLIIDQQAIQPKTTHQRDQVIAQSSEIPTLKIQGGKIDRWMKFVQKVKPRFSNYYQAVAIENRSIPFPADQLAQNLHKTTDLPVLLPDRLPWMPVKLKPSDLNVQGDRDRYIVCFGESNSIVARSSQSGAQADTCRGSSRLPVQSLTAQKGEHLESFDRTSPRTITRQVKLAQGLPGLYQESCDPQACNASMQWQYRGVTYRINARFSEQAILAKVANAAIAAGER